MKRWLPAAALVTFAVALLAYMADARPRSLMDHSARVPGFSSTTIIAPIAWGWPSSREVIFSDPSPRVPGGYSTVNIETGRVTRSTWPIPGRLNPSRAVMWLAPNGRYALHFAVDAWLLSDPHGSILGRWEHVHDGYVQWAPDSSGWTIRELNGRLVEMDLSSELPKPVQAPANGLPGWYSPSRGIGLQVSRNGKEPEFVLIPIGNSTPGAPRPIKLPADSAIVYGVQMSPRRDRLAWYIGRKNRRTPLLDWFMSALHVRAARPKAGAATQPPIDTEGIWVSDLNGDNMREVGEVKAEWAPEGMASFTWCPDGRRVLVTYRTGLYLVSVDE